MINLIIILALLGFVWLMVIKYIPMPEPMKAVINVLAIIALLIIILEAVGVDTNIHIR